VKGLAKEESRSKEQEGRNKNQEAGSRNQEGRSEKHESGSKNKEVRKDEQEGGSILASCFLLLDSCSLLLDSCFLLLAPSPQRYEFFLLFWHEAWVGCTLPQVSARVSNTRS
jgi:hypothetical protein